MTKLIIFDLDGTLLDTLEDLAVSCNHALAACGCRTLALEDYNMLVGRGIFNLFRGALPEEMRTEEMVQKMNLHFVPYYNEHSCDRTRPYDGIIDMLDRLSGTGIALAIASNKYQAGTEQLVRDFFGRYDFARILGQRDGKPIKPSPEIVYEAMEAVPDIKPEEIIYCGDSDVDMQTGRNAGVRTIGVTWGFRTREELAAYDPWIMVDNPAQIVEAVMQDLK